MTKEFPYCTVFTVALAIVCHILVLVGNLETAQTLHVLGQSSSGWSDVGLSLGRSLQNELDQLMHMTVTKLTGALDTIVQVETDIDYVLGAVANATDAAISTLQTSPQHLTKAGSRKSLVLQENARADESELASLLQSSAEVCAEKDSGAEGEELASLLQGRVHTQLVASDADVGDQEQKQNPDSNKAMDGTRAALHRQIEHLVEKVKLGVAKLLEFMKPALLQIGKWLHSMGPKMQGVIEEFSIVIDRVQKIIDEVMSKIAGAGPHSELLLHNVFAIFDVSESGYINSNDIHKVSILYGLTALQHTKGDELLSKYDADKDSRLNRQEFSLMVRDKSIPHAPTVILRTFSRKLAEVAGVVAAARQRDELAHSVVQYFTLVSSKNRAQISSISQALTNGSLPIEFVADVLKQFAQNADNPGIAMVVDVGAITIKEMVKLDADLVGKAFKMLADAKWWHHSGFDLAEQPKLVKRVSSWVAAANGHAQLLQVLTDSSSKTAGRISNSELAMLVHDSVRSSAKRFSAEQHAVKAKAFEALLSSDTSAGLFQSLLGSAALVRAGTDPSVRHVVKAGVPAKPETLRFAHWLAKNASDSAQYFQHLCFEHSHASSSSVDSLATQIQGMLKKTQNFLMLMQRYSTPRGMETLETRLKNFTSHALHEVVGIVDKQINTAFEKMGSKLPDAALIQNEQSIKGVWKEVLKFTKDLMSVLPTVIDDIKFAKKEVASVSANMLSMFPVFKTQGTPIFENMKTLYATLWVVYFVVFFLLSLAILFYGFWASGYFGGPVAQTQEEPPAGSLKDRCMICCRTCMACFCCQDSNLCFWSAILLACCVVVLMFGLSSLLSLMAGLKSWISAGCDEVYLLNDNSICIGAMQGIQNWLTTFWSKETLSTPLESMCTSRSLMTCDAISAKLKQSALFTTGGSLLATLVTCQMIFESARLHEKSRWIRMLNEKTLELKEED